jgi:hypothetical protein
MEWGTFFLVEADKPVSKVEWGTFLFVCKEL